jgi:hypothetical protein
MTLPLRLSRPKPGRCAKAAAIRGKKLLNLGQHQATVRSTRTPLGECRLTTIFIADAMRFACAKSIYRLLGRCK